MDILDLGLVLVLVACPRSCSSVTENIVVVSKICSERTDIIVIKIDQHLDKLRKENKGVPILRNKVYIQVKVLPSIF